MPLDHPATPRQTGQLVLDNVPEGILRQLQILADLKGTSASSEAARIVASYLDAETGN